MKPAGVAGVSRWADQTPPAPMAQGEVVQHLKTAKSGGVHSIQPGSVEDTTRTELSVKLQRDVSRFKDGVNRFLSVGPSDDLQVRPARMNSLRSPCWHLTPPGHVTASAGQCSCTAASCAGPSTLPGFPEGAGSPPPHMHPHNKMTLLCLASAP